MENPCPQHSIESMRQLKIGGLKITPARLLLLDILKHAKKPLSIKEIAKTLGKGGADLVTLYRNIESLKNLRLVRQINLKDRQAYFELATGKHHHHIICTNCGKLSDIEMPEIKLSKLFLKKRGFAEISDHSMEYFGLCAKCAG
jgi:Fur family ferric uptake transcriptional regulator